MLKLRMNQGDPTEGRIYFLPHFVAADRGYFRDAGLEVEFVWAPPGDHLAKSGQIPAVLSGAADLTVGGPMVTMRMLADGSAHLVNFCALVRRNPWYLAGRHPEPDFTLASLAGRTVFDAASITTAGLSLRHALAKADLSDRVTVIELPREDPAAIEDFIAGRGPGGEAEVIFHSMHALAPALAAGRLFELSDLARYTGDVPWSAYITRPETMAAQPAAFAAFASAISRALADAATTPAGELAAQLAGHYPGYPPAALAYGIAAYQRLGVWSEGAVISRADFERFRALLMDCGWFSTPVPYEQQVVVPVAAASTL
ncbi:ABC transporter substrate-binding protein [Ancylobacter terrae]|uniref:ABC transporter substrate-binding protein n=1 Tax=Ancylobacter sp. sgz301288 TaxID=3342077 RepID=UPI00385F0EE5